MNSQERKDRAGGRKKRTALEWKAINDKKKRKDIDRAERNAENEKRLRLNAEDRLNRD